MKSDIKTGKSIIDKCKAEDEFCHLEDGYLNWFPCHNKGGVTAEHLREIADYLDKENAEHHAGILQFMLDSRIKDGGYKVYINGLLVDCVPTAVEAHIAIGKSPFGSLHSVSHTDKSVDCSEFIPY